MKIYRIAKPYNQEMINHHDFIGFHCQKSPRSEYDDVILNDNHYAENFYVSILDALPNDLRMKSMDMGLMNQPEDQYSEEFDEWADRVYNFLEEHNIRWIYVSQNKPLSEQYGDYRYYVLLPDSCVLHIFDDPNVGDVADAYLYEGVNNDLHIGRNGIPRILEEWLKMLDSNEA